MDRPSISLPHAFIEVKPHVRYSPSSNQWEVDRVGNVVYFPTSLVSAFRSNVDLRSSASGNLKPFRLKRQSVDAVNVHFNAVEK